MLDVTVDKGMRHKQRITFAGMGDKLPGQLPGDVVLVLVEVMPQQPCSRVFTCR